MYIAKVQSLDDVRKAYLKMRIKYGDATHISCGYRLANAMGPFNQEAVDDSDYGCARTLLNVLKDSEMNEFAIFLARNYGGIHLGNRRFDIFKQMAEKSVQAWRKFITKKRKRTERMNSQSSINSVMSQMSDIEAEGRIPVVVAALEANS